MGDASNLAGVLSAVRECLSVGCVYSPININLLLDGPDNLVCKLYPITIERILPGIVISKERIVTIVSGEYAWPAKADAVKLYRYGSDGKLLSAKSTVHIPGKDKLQIDVPDQGLVIAEIVHTAKSAANKDLAQ